MGLHKLELYVPYKPEKGEHICMMFGISNSSMFCWCQRARKRAYWTTLKRRFLKCGQTVLSLDRDEATEKWVEYVATDGWSFRGTEKPG